jgi:murein endopeptidase
MRLPTLLIAAVVALAAAAAFAVTRRPDDARTDARAAQTTPSTAAQDRPTVRARAAGAPQASAAGAPLPSAKPAPRRRPAIHWRHSVAVGSPSAGRLIRGVQLPARGPGFATWDPNLHRSPDRAWRRWGTDRLLRVLLSVAGTYHAAHPRARPMLIGDLSRPRGGDFGQQYGYVWHASHQNGLDADVYYPRKDRARRQVRSASEMDRRLSQDLLNRFVRAGATKIFVGPGTGLTGPPGVVSVLADHDDHMHVRIAP